jgi:hypothetical protein
LSSLTLLPDNPHDERMRGDIVPLEPRLPRCGRLQRVGEREAEETLCGCARYIIVVVGGVDAEERDADGLVPWRLGEVAQG